MRPSEFDEMYETNVQSAYFLMSCQCLTFSLLLAGWPGPSLVKCYVIWPSQRPIEWKFYFQNYLLHFSVTFRQVEHQLNWGVWVSFNWNNFVCLFENVIEQNKQHKWKRHHNNNTKTKRDERFESNSTFVFKTSNAISSYDIIMFIGETWWNASFVVRFYEFMEFMSSLSWSSDHEIAIVTPSCSSLWA